MKKIEAQALAIEKSKLVIEYITQILSDKEIVNSKMNFSSANIDGQKMCTLDIYVPEKNFEKHLNLEITIDHSMILYEQILNTFLDSFLENETMGVTKYYSVKSMSENFSGVKIINLIGSRIMVNFYYEFPDIISMYNEKYTEYEKTINEKNKTK